MATLKTTFAGLELRNPIIVSSSGLTDSAEKNQKFYEAGVGAVPEISFEEQIMLEADSLEIRICILKAVITWYLTPCRANHSHRV